MRGHQAVAVAGFGVVIVTACGSFAGWWPYNGAPRQILFSALLVGFGAQFWGIFRP
jgi:hypothetical protein